MLEYRNEKGLKGLLRLSYFSPPSSFEVTVLLLLSLLSMLSLLSLLSGCHGCRVIVVVMLLLNCRFSALTPRRIIMLSGCQFVNREG